MSKIILLCLHGWGGSKESFTELREALRGTDIEIFTPDLPGFGAEPEPPKPWTTDDYANWVLNWLSQNGKWEMGNGKLFLLGHSHGGRILIKLLARSPTPVLSEVEGSAVRSPTIDHLFLCAAAGIRHPRHVKRIIGLLLAKTGKFFLSIPGLKALQPLSRAFLYRLVRVHDYEKASPVMQQTLINVSAEDLTPLLSKLTVPTDIFWGEDDRMTPVSDAHVMLRLIPGSRLHLFKNVRHRVHRDRAKEIANIILDA